MSALKRSLHIMILVVNLCHDIEVIAFNCVSCEKADAVGTIPVTSNSISAVIVPVIYRPRLRCVFCFAHFYGYPVIPPEKVYATFLILRMISWPIASHHALITPGTTELPMNFF